MAIMEAELPPSLPSDVVVAACRSHLDAQVSPAGRRPGVALRATTLAADQVQFHDTHPGGLGIFILIVIAASMKNATLRSHTLKSGDLEFPP